MRYLRFRCQDQYNCPTVVIDSPSKFHLTQIIKGDGGILELGLIPIYEMGWLKKQRSPSPAQGVSPPPLKRRRLSSSDHRSASLLPSPSPILFQSDTTFATIKTLRIYSWNVNGIHPFLPPTTPPITNFLASSCTPKPPPSQPSLRANLHRWQWPHVLFLQEVKIAPKDTKTPDLLRRAINTPRDAVDEPIFKSQLYDAHFCLPRSRYNATGFGGKVYGVCTLVRQDIAPDANVKTVEWDLEGRVQVTELPSLGLIVFNIYAVNGTTNDYRDPDTGNVVGTRHDRKRAFHSLLANEVRAYEEKGWHVIIAGDINISRAPIDSFPQLQMGSEHAAIRADFEQKFINGLGMLDTFRLLHGEKRKYSYRPRTKPWGAGGDRVDMILATKGLKEAVKEADVLDGEAERGPSDHVPLFTAFEISQRRNEEERVEAAMPTVRDDSKT